MEDFNTSCRIVVTKEGGRLSFNGWFQPELGESCIWYTGFEKLDSCTNLGFGLDGLLQ